MSTRSLRLPSPAARTLVAAAAAVGVVTLAAAPAAARAPGPRAVTAATAPAASSTDATAPTRTITVSATARVRGTPDVLTMTLGVSSKGHTVGEALDRNNAAAKKVMGVLLDGGVDKKDIQTSSFSIGPEYDPRTTAVTGYTVSNLVTVQLRDLEHAGSLIDRAANAGGDDVVMRGVSFSFDDASDLVTAARAEAVKRARAQADQLAHAAGVELADVRTVSESTPDAGPVVAAPEAAGKASSDVSIQPGSEELSVQVTIVYSIR